jgi:hypothetical protein
MKLISMTDFVLEQNENFKSDRFYQGQFKDNVVNYANFLKQPLKLEMFVPCDEDGNVLEEPDQDFELTFWDYSTKMSKYEQAKEKVLFEGFEVCNRTTKIDCVVYNEDHITLKLLKDKTIEYLINRNLTLTPTAIKRIFG